jgi:hypothetical protein
MRTVALVALTLCSGLAGGIAGASAQDYPFCKQGRSAGYPGDCSFSTYAQCQATASGTNDGCGLNPRFAYRHQRYSASGTAYRTY